MSSHLQELESGMTMQAEVRADQLGNINIICRVRKAEIIAEAPTPEETILLTLQKK
ncbi:hypothetical protein [Desulfovibrio sp. JC010]|uniref:hypothetical protein n=1 Tax=Desulfovibrio sp. JC010 TaxID=2593641 RepID=UPI0013D042FC|nr:hypothetical protein [Desulfovibrio sp. JC010]